ncbi:hypothetical protein PC129_g7349 [Phytophthora cactorum]|uniref:Uncharacterized protein n=1 Tax=Phytophthora cactorum TaxID=29920 RepID=A0A329S7V2_9STRA|nr:hypothetical protein Pcac1_g28149 [Phytophthora cactorum]KAG2833812.1 hypothetical protein PC112_g6346 [Phytophthora cactorum]KAG2836230.1 hypothetical protein PC111_g5126 [Phytophthora cactorum]KAG2861928.1 hypothetical protein PC113_g6772 [Phytophthora cactorum]KAG2919037.1 hypothetical protein PC114_g6586 [Phytophthora cactorum]
MGHGKRWKEVEDEALAATYVALTSAGVRSGALFWESVRDRIKGVRSARAQQNRWLLISQDVKVFVGCLRGIKTEEMGEEEAVERARNAFRERMDREFEFLGCWRIVRNCPKIGGRSQVEAAAKCEVPHPVSAATEPPPPAVASTASPTVASAVAEETAEHNESGTTATTTLDLEFVHHQLTSEMRRKNDLQEDELAMKLFAEARESEDSQRFFKLLKRKKLLQLEQQVDELEQAQQRRRQRRS